VLLSSIYTHLQDRFEKGSAHRVRAMLAYIFTVTCGDYFQSLSRSIGYHGELTASRSKKAFISSGLDLGEEGDQEDGGSVSNDDVEEFPNFISSEVTDVLIRARKSLKFLSTAQPDHPVLQHPASRRRVSWFWTNEEVTAAWYSKNPVNLSDAVESEPDSVVNSDTSPDNSVLGQFKVFSLEPGTHLTPSARGADSTLQSFLANFPSHLPALTPTLSHLSDLVLFPLLAHGTAISGALISLLLSPESHLHIHSHLTLLRSYFLLTLPAFTMRLQAALFSDSDDWNFEGSTMRAMAKSTPQNKKSAVPGGSHAQWAVGLGLGLAERDSWPPGGSDLSYYLRTVIVDSLESLVKLTDGQFVHPSEGRRQIFVEAEYRLGFAIRDLPAGSGRERWLNPSCEYSTLDHILYANMI
jgi:hypothetical protein